jgi:hypothetical protein
VYYPNFAHQTSATALSDSKFVLVYSNKAVIGDVSGNTITYGLDYVYSSSGSGKISVVTLSSTKFVVACMDGSKYGKAVIGEVSGNTITCGSEYVFNSDWIKYVSAAALSSTKFVITYMNYENFGYGTAVIGEVSGNTITYGSDHVFNSAETGYTSAAALSSTKFVVAYEDWDKPHYGTGVICDVSTDGKNIYDKVVIGIAKESKTTGQTVPVIIGGVSDVQSGLTPGVVYYSFDSGDLTANPTNCRMGLAISDTEILLANPFT